MLSIPRPHPHMTADAGFVGGISPHTRFGGIGGAAAANTVFLAAKSDNTLSSRRPPT